MSQNNPSIQQIQPLSSDTGPVSESARLLGIDATRAIALLGIFFVNAVLFGKPFASLFRPHAPTEEGLASIVVFWFTGVFCTGKFYPLFSLLFGVGLAMMFQSAKAAGRSFGWMFFRRLIGLGAIGLLHITLLWWGDVLLIYATVGLAMLLLGRATPKTLFRVAAVAFVLSLALPTGLRLAFEDRQPKTEAVEKAMPIAANRVEQIRAVLKDWNTSQQYDSRLAQLEIESSTQGPFAAAMLIRILNYLFCLPFFITSFAWVVLTCFCLGAALLKLGFFHGKIPEWRGRFIRIGLLFGLPLSALAAYGSLHKGIPAWGLISMLGMNIGGPLMSLMYMSLILNWVESGRLAGLARVLANLGKMGLTGYLLESTLMSSVMMYWGMGRYGVTTWWERAAWVVGIYLVILLIANLWMSRFRFGPMEWLWRSWTYFRLQPLRRQVLDTAPARRSANKLT